MFLTVKIEKSTLKKLFLGDVKYTDSAVEINGFAKVALEPF